jgi:hypothetical protein
MPRSKVLCTLLPILDPNKGFIRAVSVYFSFPMAKHFVSLFPSQCCFVCFPIYVPSCCMVVENLTRSDVQFVPRFCPTSVLYFSFDSWIWWPTRLSCGVSVVLDLFAWLCEIHVSGLCEKNHWTNGCSPCWCHISDPLIAHFLATFGRNITHKELSLVKLYVATRHILMHQSHAKSCNKK